MKLLFTIILSPIWVPFWLLLKIARSLNRASSSLVPHNIRELGAMMEQPARTSNSRAKVEIADVVERGQSVFVYDERGKTLCVIPGGDGVRGYTSNTVTIRRRRTLYTYDPRGKLLHSKST